MGGPIDYSKNGNFYSIGDNDLMDGTKQIINDEPNYEGDGIDREPCPKPDCYYHDERGFCLLESCLLREVPKLHSDWYRKCDLCRKTYIVNGTTGQPWTHVCEPCRRHWEDTVLNNWWFTCGTCGARQNGNRMMPDADMCDTCVTKLSIILAECPLVN